MTPRRKLTQCAKQDNKDPVAFSCPAPLIVACRGFSGAGCVARAAGTSARRKFAYRRSALVPNGVCITTTWMLRGGPPDDVLAGDRLPRICWGARFARIGIASSILETVYAEARKRPGENIIAVGLRIGELSSISPDAHTFAFETLTRETP